MFAKYQPLYAEQGIATFPVEFIAEGNNKWRKKPAIRGWQTAGPKGSADLASKFVEADGIGCQCGPRKGLTIVDIDRPDPECPK